jgi:DNA-binding response OmpR family regulator
VPMIVIVEDEPLVAFFYSRLLRDDGHDTAEFSRAEDALSYILSCPVDVIVTDVNLASSMTGLQLAREVRLSGYTGPIVICSGDILAPEQVPEGSLVMPKPVLGHQLTRMIARLLDPPSQARIA